MLDMIMALVFFTILGWIVHKIFGKDGGLLHYAFVGGCGSGIGIILEEITGLYTSNFAGAIGLCLICACVVECIIRRLKRRFQAQDVGDWYVDIDE